jgi:hypothetical protein
MQPTPQEEHPRQWRLEQSRVLSSQEEVRPSVQPCFDRQQCEVHQGLFGRASFRISQLQTNSTYLTLFISSITLSCKIADASSHDTWHKLIDWGPCRMLSMSPTHSTCTMEQGEALNARSRARMVRQKKTTVHQTPGCRLASFCSCLHPTFHAFQVLFCKNRVGIPTGHG